MMFPAENPQEEIKRLTDAGLYVSEPGPNERYSIGKPDTVPGNSVPGYEKGLSSQGLIFDAPVVRMSREGQKWVVTVHEYIPGPGTGDFTHEFTHIKDAVDDVFSYFFDATSPMLLLVKENAEYDEWRRKDKAEEDEWLKRINAREKEWRKKQKSDDATDQ